MHTLRFTLPTQGLFRLDFTVWALRRRERNELDLWDGQVYTRVLALQNVAVKIEVRQTKRNCISVTAKCSSPVPHLKSQLSTILNQMLGLKIDLKQFYAKMKDEKDLYPLVQKFKGVKPPRFPSLFETLVNAICFQQLSLEAGLSLLNNFTLAYGKTFRDKNRTFYAFPEPKRITKCSPKELASLGFSRRKSEALIALASTLPDLAERSNQEIIDLLCDFKGIGRWSAEYTLLRGLGKTEILPGDDVGIKNSIKTILHLKKLPSYEKIKQLEKKWSPFAGVVYFHLLLQKLEEKGIIHDQNG